MSVISWTYAALVRKLVTETAAIEAVILPSIFYNEKQP